ncbi:MAG: aldose 1-epimerase family protein [Lachnospiraceae bacterium]|nr:aldose 1-epimerase family protein [Lachnospiraceae bacterium]
MKEILLENDKLKAVCLPELGGKVRSLILKGRDIEIAAQPGTGKIYRAAESDGNFGDYDMSGLDDAFPNIDAETLTYGGRVFSYPDHGEIWSREMEVLGAEKEKLGLCWFSPRFSYNYFKTLSLSGSSLVFSYEIKNAGDTDFPCIWTMHGLLRFERDMRLVFPEGMDRIVNVLPDTPLGEKDSEHSLSKGEFDFTRMPDASALKKAGWQETEPWYMKYYGAGPVGEGSCQVIYPSDGIKAVFSYDAEKLPWLGVWINAGGFSGDYNLAMEMTNGFYDQVSKALDNNRCCVLKPGEKLSFEVSLSVTDFDGNV